MNRNDVLSKSDKNSKHDKIVSRNIILDDIIVIVNCIRELFEVRDGILQCDFDSSDIDDMINTMCCMPFVQCFFCICYVSCLLYFFSAK